MEQVRMIREDELDQLLALYKYLNPDDPQLLIDAKLNELWRDIMTDPHLHYVVMEVDGRLVSSCALAIIKNLTRRARPYGVIENVVTDPGYRQRGFGKAVLKRAVDIARETGCYKVMLMTGRKEESTLKFYDSAGFHRGEKTAYQIRF